MEVRDAGKEPVSSTSGKSASEIASSYFPLGVAVSHEFKSENFGEGKRNSRINPSYSESTTGSDHSNTTKKFSEPSRSFPIDPSATSKTTEPAPNFTDPIFFQNRIGPYPWNPYTALPGLYANAFPHMQYAGDGRSKHSSPTGEFDHKYEFRTLLAKQADEKSKKHVQNVGRTIRSIVRMIGTFETTFVTVRGCFYGLLCAIEYGTLGWQMFMNIPVVRMAFDVFRWFWRYVKFVGRNGPLVGVFALICTYVGRTCLPLIKNAVSLYRSGGTSTISSTTKTVKFSYFAKKSEELSVTLGEEVTVEGGKLGYGHKESGEEMILVRRVKPLPGRPISGLVPKSVLFRDFERTPATDRK